MYNLSDSTNWSGIICHKNLYQPNHKRFKSVTGSWFVPAISQPPQPAGPNNCWTLSIWVGLDGGGTIPDGKDVLQTGISASLDPQGMISYQAWYEWAAPESIRNPRYVSQLNIHHFPVRPGDLIVASVWYDINPYDEVTGGYVMLENKTTNHIFKLQKPLTPPPKASKTGGSAEWIVEAPGVGGGLASIPAFSPVFFSSCYAASDEIHYRCPSEPCSESREILLDTGSPIGKIPLTQATKNPWREDCFAIEFIGGQTAFLNHPGIQDSSFRTDLATGLENRF